MLTLSRVAGLIFTCGSSNLIAVPAQDEGSAKAALTLRPAWTHIHTQINIEQPQPWYTDRMDIFNYYTREFFPSCGHFRHPSCHNRMGQKFWFITPGRIIINPIFMAFHSNFMSCRDCDSFSHKLSTQILTPIFSTDFLVHSLLCSSLYVLSVSSAAAQESLRFSVEGF